MKKLLVSSSIFLCLTLAACSIHRLDIQQGNIITPEMLDTLEIGMDKERVRFIMGTPPLTDPFNQKRWDYVYILTAKKEAGQRSRVTLWFNDEGKLDRIDRQDYVAPKVSGE